MRSLFAVISLGIATGAQAADRSVQPIPAQELAEEAIHLCARDLRDEHGLRAAINGSRFQTEEVEKTLQGLRSNWNSSYGYIYYTTLPEQAANSELAKFLPQCNVEGVASATMDRANFEKIVSEELNRSGHVTLEKRVRSKSTVWLLRQTAGADAALIWVNASEGGEQIVLSFQPAAAADLIGS